MEIWTYQKAMTKVVTDQDLEEIFEDNEAFVSKNEMIGYFNEALTEAESEIQALNEDYFLTKFYVPLVEGQKVYALPENIFANKIRGMFYQNGTINYPVEQFRRRNKFENIALVDQYGRNEYYRYTLKNDYPGQAEMEIHPAPRETAIMGPDTDRPFVPLSMDYIRNCARVPLIGEFCNPELVPIASVNGDEIAVVSGLKSEIGVVAQGVAGCYPGSIPYVTGDAIRIRPITGGAILGGVVEGTTYYVINDGGGVIKLAETKADAKAGNAITLSTTGATAFIIEVMATEAIVNATILDIPEFTMFLIQWAKCRCLEKERDPAFDAASKVLLAMKKQMIDTLTNAIQDDNNEVEADFSAYNELS